MLCYNEQVVDGEDSTGVVVKLCCASLWCVDVSLNVDYGVRIGFFQRGAYMVGSCAVCWARVFAECM